MLNITRGKKRKPLAIMIHGEHGLGKTNLLANDSDAIFIGSEENDEIEAARFPKVKTWAEFKTYLNQLKTQEHSFKTLVIDSIDTLEQVAQKEILDANPGKTLATVFGGYGKGYEKLKDMFLDIRDEFLVPLRDNKNMNIVLLAHSSKESVEDPMSSTSYTKYETGIYKKIKPVFEDWVSAILFITYQVYKAENSQGKEYAVGDGERIILTEERPSHVAKNRFNLPYEIQYKKEGTWQTIVSYIDNYFASNIAKSEELSAIEELLNKIKDTDTKAAIKISLERAKGNEKELERIRKKMLKLIEGE